MTHKNCIICNRPYVYSVHVDTCGERCFKQLLKRQRHAILLAERVPQNVGTLTQDANND